MRLKGKATTYDVFGVLEIKGRIGYYTIEKGKVPGYPNEYCIDVDLIDGSARFLANSLGKALIRIEQIEHGMKIIF